MSQCGCGCGGTDTGSFGGGGFFGGGAGGGGGVGEEDYLDSLLSSRKICFKCATFWLIIIILAFLVFAKSGGK